jgi:hypothetical protein
MQTIIERGYSRETGLSEEVLEMLASKRTRPASRLRRALVVLVSATLIAAVFPIAAVAVDGYRADTGSYAEEGFGLLPEFLPFTEIEYRADTGSYAEEGFGLLR